MSIYPVNAFTENERVSMNLRVPLYIRERVREYARTHGLTMNAAAIMLLKAATESEHGKPANSVDAGECYTPRPT